jgi:uncharacterized DUF497 family protein
MERASYEWDEAKRAANLAKHGIDFRDIVRFDWSAASAGPDLRRRYGETRLLAFGPIDGRVHAVVFTLRGSVYRIISLRKANRREQAAYRTRVRS